MLAHTWSSARGRRYWFNGREGGELAAYAMAAGHDHGVPIIMATGCTGLCREAHAWFGPDLVTVPVKQLRPDGTVDLFPAAFTHSHFGPAPAPPSNAHTTVSRTAPDFRRLWACSSPIPKRPPATTPSAGSTNPTGPPTALAPAPSKPPSPPPTPPRPITRRLTPTTRVQTVRSRPWSLLRRRAREVANGHRSDSLVSWVWRPSHVRWAARGAADRSPLGCTQTAGKRGSPPPQPSREPAPLPGPPRPHRARTCQTR